MEFWMAGFLVIPKVYAVIASPFSIQNHISFFLRKMHPSQFRLPIQFIFGNSCGLHIFSTLSFGKLKRIDFLSFPYHHPILLFSLLWPPQRASLALGDLHNG
jgi:hypothetical protein